ncbi:RPM1-interacting protein 4-like isoform X2 [Salvia miltiorrhiza]|uniref:RPM1-interacting protein 4-like isoform X2 n=1 Tax=Salvia miltiorrhiza TaxID=226208 RepID=UPI0025AB5F07|nr:RPM1-interacting protein 4-like isoform X2 [Salvia miltiorrhiza]
MARSNVPKFGNWENEQNDVPYTVYFNNARKNKGGKMINPNDPLENPEMFAHLEPSPLAAAAPPTPPQKPRARPEEPIGRGAVRPAPDQRDGDFRQINSSSTRNEPNYGGRGRGQRSARSARPPSAGSELSFERSPLHPQPRPQANAVARATGSPAWEGPRSHDSSHGTPSRSRLRPVRPDESHEKGAAVPRFGEWDENDPQSAENFTHIFNKVREDRNMSEAGNGSTTPKHPSYAPQRSNEPKVRPTSSIYLSISSNL